jgi:hypothetical protein
MRDLPKITFILGGPTVALKSIVLSQHTNKKTTKDTGNISLPSSSRNITEKEIFTNAIKKFSYFEEKALYYFYKDPSVPQS